MPVHSHTDGYSDEEPSSIAYFVIGQFSLRQRMIVPDQFRAQWDVPRSLQIPLILSGRVWGNPIRPTTFIFQLLKLASPFAESPRRNLALYPAPTAVRSPHRPLVWRACWRLQQPRA